jgi:hypothetical protein
MMIRSIARGLQRSDPELAATLLKWSPKIENIVHGVMRATGQDEEDIIQDLLLKVLSDVRAYRKEQIRYTPPGGKRQIWDVIEIVNICGVVTYHLQRGDYKMSLLEGTPGLEPLVKCSLSTFVYTGIIQHTHDVFSRFFQSRNGFSKAAPDTQRVFNRAKRQFVEVTRGRSVRTTHTVGIEEAEDVSYTSGIDSALNIGDLLASPESDIYILRAVHECGEDSPIVRQLVANSLRYHAHQGPSRSSAHRRIPSRSGGWGKQLHQGE